MLPREPKKLSELCIRQIGRAFHSIVKKHLLVNKKDCWLSILDIARDCASKLDDALPSHLLRDVLSHVTQSYGVSGFLLSCLLAHRTNEKVSDNGVAMDAVPPSELVLHLIRNLGSGIRGMIFEKTNVSDEHLSALAESDAASGLLELSFSSSWLITDASAHLWTSFSNLEELAIHQTSQFGVLSFRAISRMQNLRRLIATVSKRNVPEAMMIFVGEGGLPSLTHLKLIWKDKHQTSGRFLQYLCAAVTSRYDRSKIEALELDYPEDPDTIGFDWMFLDKVHFANEIHRMCPNLKTPFWWTRVQGYDPKLFKNLTSLRVPSHISAPKSTSNKRLSEMFPLLESLDITVDKLAGIQIDKFSCLNTLWLDLADLKSLNKLPPTMRDLSVKSEAAETAEFDIFFQSLKNSCPDLEKLRLHSCVRAFNRGHVTFILENFLNLEVFSIENCGEVDRAENGDIRRDEPILPVEISHPNLTSLPVIKLGSYAAVPKWMPKMHKFIRTASEMFMDRFVTRESLPNVKKIEVKGTQDGNVDISKYLKLARENQVYSISLLTPRDDDMLIKFSNLKQLTSLRLGWGGYSIANVQRLLRELPLLRDLMVGVMCEGKMASGWLHHARLQTLVLGMHSYGKRILYTSSVRFDSSSTPNLIDLNLILPGEISAVEIFDLPKLQEVKITGAKCHQNLAITVHGCPNLRTLKVEHFVLCLVDLVGLDSLKSLLLMKCSFAPGLQLSDLNFPRMARALLPLKKNTDPSDMNAYYRIREALTSTQEMYDRLAEKTTDA